MISHPERVQTRLALKRLNDLVEQIETALEQDSDLPDILAIRLRQLTQTDDLGGHLSAITQLRDETAASYRAKLLDAAPKSLSCYAEFMFPEEPPAAHHEYMCDKLEQIEARETMRMVLSMPPGHAKSRYCSVIFPSWYMGRHPRHKYMQGGYAQEFVEKNFGMKVKGIVETPDFGLVFPELAINPELKANGYWGLIATGGKNKGRALGEYVTRGVGQGISGFRSNCTGIDDPYANLKDAESPTVIKDVFNWFTADVTPRLLPKAPMFIVATRWTTLDICAKMEEWNKEGRGIPWDIINLPALATNTSDELGRSEDEPLWPEFYDKSHLLNLKATLPPRSWNSLYQGSPIDEEGGTLKGTMIKSYAVLPKKEAIRRVVLSVDCASKANERADYSVVTVWYEGLDGKHYLVDVLRRRVEFTDLVRMIEDTARTYGANAILVEDKGSGTQYIQVRDGKAPAPIIPINPGNASKEFRFDAVTPMFEGGLVLTPEVSHWLADYVRELLTFPLAAHDDQVDSTSQYLSWAHRGRAGGTKKLVGLGSPSYEAQVEAVQRAAVTATRNVIGG